MDWNDKRLLISGKAIYGILLIIGLSMCSAISAKKKDLRPHVRFETTMGQITVALFNETPLHRDNFLKLVREHYYDSLLFHRIIPDFMIQSGDPDSRRAPRGKVLGDGGPGYTLPAEIRVPDLYHWRGALAAAREGDDVNPERRSSGSQFYIVYGRPFTQQKLSDINSEIERATDGTVSLTPEMRQDYETRGGAPHLDGQYTVFGEVVEGLDVVKKMERVKTDRNDRPLQDVRIIRAQLVK